MSGWIDWSPPEAKSLFELTPEEREERGIGEVSVEMKAPPLKNGDTIEVTWTQTYE